jgi:hypothetical protein
MKQVGEMLRSTIFSVRPSPSPLTITLRYQWTPYNTPSTGGSGNSANVYIVIPFSGGKIINPTSVFDGMISSRFFAK